MATARQILDCAIPERIQTYDRRDVILYGLGIGLGMDVGDRDALPFIYEERLKTLPSLATVLAAPGFWWRDAGLDVDWRRIVHGEQSIELLRPLPPEGRVRSRNKIKAVIDKGAGKGAIVIQERLLEDLDTGETYCRLFTSSFLRGDGGIGSGGEPPSPLTITSPENAATTICDLPTSPQSAAIYRLCGDLNPLHIDPEAAAAAGFDRPILHGLATFGLTAYGLIRSIASCDPARLQAMSLRFRSPVYPGERLRLETHGRDEAWAFRVVAIERDVVVLSDGFARILRVSPI